MPLNVEVSGHGPPLVLLHGFTQTARLWGPFGQQLAQHFTLIGIDLPGHGGSDEVRADLPETASQIADAVRGAVGSDPVSMLGYSLGARVGLHVMTMAALPLQRVVLIGGTGGIEDADVRAERRRADEAAADALEASGDVDTFIARWVSGPMFSRLAAAADVDERRRNTAPGLASSLRLAGVGTQDPLWDQLEKVSVPLLALAGTDDVRFAAHAQRLARSVQHGVASFIPGGGHAVHLAQPDGVGRLVCHWLTTE